MNFQYFNKVLCVWPSAHKRDLRFDARKAADLGPREAAGLGPRKAVGLGPKGSGSAGREGLRLAGRKAD
ncbi:MAG TPA: hypothetical protein VN608_01330 [Clostridia bacterium]|nr:hypothetical protein [Clostridia bacterium]